MVHARDDAVRRVLGLVAAPEVLSTDDDLLEILPGRGGPRERTQPSEWLNVHKQVANRLLEPFMWHTVIVTATEWDNFWNLRCHPDAQPEIRLIAEKMRAAVEASDPTPIERDEWHLPLIRAEDREAAATEDLVKISAGRCARISYLTHAGKRDLDADVALARPPPDQRPHVSPGASSEAADGGGAGGGEWCGNFRGWCSYRKQMPGETDPLGPTVPARAEPLTCLSSGGRAVR